MARATIACACAASAATRPRLPSWLPSRILGRRGKGKYRYLCWKSQVRKVMISCEKLPHQTHALSMLAQLLRHRGHTAALIPGSLGRVFAGLVQPAAPRIARALPSSAHLHLLSHPRGRRHSTPGRGSTNARQLATAPPGDFPGPGASSSTPGDLFVNNPWSTVTAEQLGGRTVKTMSYQQKTVRSLAALRYDCYPLASPLATVTAPLPSPAPTPL